MTAAHWIGRFVAPDARIVGDISALSDEWIASTVRLANKIIAAHGKTGEPVLHALFPQLETEVTVEFKDGVLTLTKAEPGLERDYIIGGFEPGDGAWRLLKEGDANPNEAIEIEKLIFNKREWAGLLKAQRVK